MTPSDLRELLIANLDESILKLNNALSGNNLQELIPALTHIYTKHALPPWFEKLEKDHCLPNLDGKTIGSVIEMLYVSVLEKYIFSEKQIHLSVNPAKGIDIPELELGIKSPSTNYCTSEPFFSSYERLLGNPYDVLVLLTDYQDVKDKPPLRIQIIKWKYLHGSQIADSRLCKIAKKHRDWLLKEDKTECRKFVSFLAHIVQGEWLPRNLLRIVEVMDDEKAILNQIELANEDFKKKNDVFEAAGKELIPDEDIELINGIKNNKILYLGVINAANNWVIAYHRDFARSPNDDEWSRFLFSPLDGVIGMSYALQWRFNFRPIFNGSLAIEDEDEN
jgi:hypothetical protein